MPKRGLNVNQCEVFRFYKLLATGNICESISMIVPRKSTLFQSDLYPDTLSSLPATTVTEWLQGRNVQPILVSMQTGQSVAPNSIKTSNTQNNLMRDGSMTMVNGGGGGGVAPLTTNHKNYNNKENEIYQKKRDNNSKKFEFLAQQTTPVDYRPHPQQITDKNQKTSTNTSTKFSQLKAIFGQQTNNKEIVNLQNNYLSTSENPSQSNSLENLSLINSENELRKAFIKQTDEIKNLKNKLSDSEERVRELEHEIKRLQLLIIE